MHILLGIGGARDSLLALHETAERAALTGDRLTVAILENPESKQTPTAIEETVLEEVKPHGIDVRVEHLDGDPGPALVSYAESGEFDRLVIGGGKRSPMGKIALGPIAEFALLNADISITLIR